MKGTAQVDEDEKFRCGLVSLLVKLVEVDVGTAGLVKER